MVWKSLMKKPVLVIGIILFVLFLFDQKRRSYPLLGNRILPTSCRAVVVKLEKRIPNNWQLECEKNNLAVTIESLVSMKDEANAALLKGVLYRDLANNLIFIAKNSPQETLERVFIVRIHQHHPKLIIDAVTEGKDISKFATLRDTQFISDHLKATVQVKESFK